MLMEIISKLTKTWVGSDVTSEKVLVWAKRVEAQKVQSTLMTSLLETKDCDKIKTVKGGQIKLEKPQICTKLPANQSCRYCISSHSPSRCLTYGMMCVKFCKINHFREVCKSGRNRTIYDLKQEQDQHHKEVDYIDMVNINYIYFNNIQQ